MPYNYHQPPRSARVIIRYVIAHGASATDWWSATTINDDEVSERDAKRLDLLVYRNSSLPWHPEINETSVKRLNFYQYLKNE